MWPIILCSLVAMGIIAERFWTLQTKKLLPPNLVSQVWGMYKSRQLGREQIVTLRDNSPLGSVLAAGLLNHKHGREMMKESIDESGRHAVHDMERFLNTLGTIASITPLLGLLGTVVGMIEVFAAIMDHGVGDPEILAGGISKALITTAAGLSVAIPSLIFHRYFHGKVDELVLKMEQESMKLVEVLHGEREDERA